MVVPRELFSLPREPRWCPWLQGRIEAVINILGQEFVTSTNAESNQPIIDFAYSQLSELTLVKVLNSQESRWCVAGQGRIEAVINMLGQEFATSTNANHRKGGLIGLAATAIGLMAHIKEVISRQSLLGVTDGSGGQGQPHRWMLSWGGGGGG
jgi:hypothetical protein